jgi:hypothetical protein
MAAKRRLLLRLFVVAAWVASACTRAPHGSVIASGARERMDDSSVGRRAGPGVRNGHRMAGDAVRDEIILFGGVGPQRQFLDDTWILRGGRWLAHRGRGPSARAWHTMTYDADRGVIVLFGGRGPNGAVADTWVWDGSRWTEVAGSGPSARDHHAAAYDAAARAVLAFGGFDGSRVHADTWRFREGSWTELRVTGPPARAAHAMSSHRNGVLLFGGLQLPDTILGDTWLWSNGSWARVAFSAPPLSHLGMQVIERCSCVARFGGKDQHRVPLNATWMFGQPDGWTVTTATGPSARIDFAFTTLGSEFYVHGGKLPDPDGRQFGDLWAFDTAVWRKLH